MPNTLVVTIHRQARQDHHWHRVLRDAFDHSVRGCCRFDTANCQTVEADHDTRLATDVGLCAVGLLIDQRETLQELIECGLAAIEGIDGVCWGQFTNWLVSRRTQPSSPGLESNPRSFGLALTGWSSAA